MAEKLKGKTVKVTTPTFRVSYPNVFKPKLNKLNNKMEFSVEALFPKGTDFTKVKAAIAEAAETAWGTDRTKWPSPLKLPLKLQDTKKKKKEDGTEYLPPPYEAGCFFASFKSEQQPGVVDQQVQPIREQTAFYAGVWANASVSARAYSQGNNHGVSLWLNNLQKVKDGEPLGGRSRPEDDFVAVQMDEVPGSDPTMNI